ncbi:MAG: hypothetical protein V7637_5160 [Mycobacteriales bacterium]
MADEPARGRVERWVSFAGTIVAPVTLLSALLFYFGYVSSRSQYQYFGLDVDTIGLGTRDYVMRSPQPLLVPLLALSLAGAGVLALHAMVSGRVSAAADGEHGAERVGLARRVGQIRRAAHGLTATGMVLLGAGVGLLFAYGYVRGWVFYNLVTPALLGAGAALISYGTRVRHLLGRLPAERPVAPAAPGRPARTGGTPGDGDLLLRRTAGILVYVVIAASLFWATATVAQWSGRGLAQYDAQHLNRLPSVILDTKERLYLRAPGIEETILPWSDGQLFRYRYRRLRLLIQGHDRMFLVPEKWSASDTTLVVQLDGTVRLQFQFQNPHG